MPHYDNLVCKALPVCGCGAAVLQRLLAKLIGPGDLQPSANCKPD